MEQILMRLLAGYIISLVIWVIPGLIIVFMKGGRVNSFYETIYVEKTKCGIVRAELHDIDQVKRYFDGKGTLFLIILLPILGALLFEIAWRIMLKRYDKREITASLW